MNTRQEILSKNTKQGLISQILFQDTILASKELEIATLKAELTGQNRVFRLLELMAGEANLGLKISR